MEERSESDVDERVPTYPLKLQMSPPYDQLEQEKDETSFNRALWSPSYRIDSLRLSSESDDCLSPSSRQISHSSEDETRSLYNENLVSDDRSHRFDLFRISSSDSDDCADLLSTKTAENQREKQAQWKYENGERQTPHSNVTESSPFVIPSTSHFALRRHLKRQPPTSPFPAGSREGNEDARGFSTQRFRLLSRPTVSTNRSSFPMPLKSPKTESPVSTTRKINRSTCSTKSPRNATIKGRHFVFPEISRVPRTSTRKTRVGSGSVEEEHRKGGKSSTKDGQKDYRNWREKHREKSQDINSSIPSLPKICQLKQGIQSRDQVGSSSRMASWAMAPKGPRRSPRSHAAKQSTSTSLGEISGRSLGKNRNKKRFSLPAIPVGHVMKSEYSTAPATKDSNRTLVLPSRPSNNRFALPPIPQAQFKRTPYKTGNQSERDCKTP